MTHSHGSMSISTTAGTAKTRRETQQIARNYQRFQSSFSISRQIVPPHTIPAKFARPSWRTRNVDGSERRRPMSQQKLASRSQMDQFLFGASACAPYVLSMIECNIYTAGARPNCQLPLPLCRFSNVCTTTARMGNYMLQKNENGKLKCR